MKRVAVLVLTSLTAFSSLLPVGAQEVRRSKEGWNWNKWVMNHQDWVRYHPKKAEYYENHPDAAQRFLNNWYRNHRK